MIEILTIPGDGIGREVIPAAVAVLQSTGLPLSFREAEAGWECFQRHDTALPDATLQAARHADAILFGAVASPSFPVAGYRSPIVALRRALDLYANIRPVQGSGVRGQGSGGDGTAEPLNHRTENHIADVAPVHSTFNIQHSTFTQNSKLKTQNSKLTDLIVVRENTEGLYAGRERTEDNGDTAIAERVITRHASERLVRTAFELARQRHHAGGGRPTLVTIVHKANVLRETCGLFRRVALEVAATFPDIPYEEMLVDVAAMRIAQHPERFDVVVTTNLFGDILSDIACIHGGGLGLATSANIGTKHALFEPVHGAAPDIAGKGIANPLAAIGCTALLLDWLAPRQEAQLAVDCTAAANRIRAAVAHILTYGPHTPDLGGTATTEEIVEGVLSFEV